MLDAILEFIFHIVVETVCFYTGEIVLYVVTFGRKKPRWDFYTDEGLAKSILLSEPSVWIGFFFWIFVIGGIARSLFY